MYRRDSIFLEVSGYKLLFKYHTEGFGERIISITIASSLEYKEEANEKDETHTDNILGISSFQFANMFI